MAVTRAARFVQAAAMMAVLSMVAGTTQAEVYTWTGAGAGGWRGYRVWAVTDTTYYINNWGRIFDEGELQQGLYGNWIPGCPGSHDDVVIPEGRTASLVSPDLSASFNNMTLNGTFRTPNGSRIQMFGRQQHVGRTGLLDQGEWTWVGSWGGSLANDGLIVIGGGSYWDVCDSLSITGNGILRLVQGQFKAIAPFGSSSYVLTNGPGHTIESRGPADPGYENNLLTNNLINDGVIQATEGSVLNANCVRPNRGLLRAVSGGTLKLGLVEQEAGSAGIVAEDGSRVVFGSVTGGTLVSKGTGILEHSGGSLTDVTNMGTLRMVSTYATYATLSGFTNKGQVDGSAYMVLLGSAGMVNDGTMSLGELRADGESVAVTGTGTLDVGRIVRNYPLTNGQGHTIHCRDGVFADFVNKGLLRCDGGWLNYDGTSYPSAGSTTITNEGTIQIPAGCSVQIYDATHYLQPSGQTLVDGSLSFWQEMSVGSGFLRGCGLIAGNVSNATGKVEPGNTIGTLTIRGHYTQGTSGQLAIDLAATQPGQSDVLDVQVGNLPYGQDGVAVLDGRLHIRGRSPFSLHSGDEFVILTAASISGQFATITGSGRYQVLYDANTVKIRVIDPPLPADSNGDNWVNVGDLQLLVVSWGSSSRDLDRYDADRDTNGDGYINVGDLQLLVANWGQGLP